MRQSREKRGGGTAAKVGVVAGCVIAAAVVIAYMPGQSDEVPVGGGRVPNLPPAVYSEAVSEESAAAVETDLADVGGEQSAAKVEPVPNATEEPELAGLDASLPETNPRKSSRAEYDPFSPALDGGTFYVDARAAGASDENPGTAEKPWRTIGKAAETAVAGDRVIIRGGTYRESVEVKNSGTAERPIVFAAEKKHAAYISGSDPLTGWTAEQGGVFSVPWPHDFIIDTRPDGSKVRNHGAEAPVGCAEQLFWQLRALKQVMNRDALRPGTFYVDWSADRLYTKLPGDIDPNSAGMLGGTRPLLFGPFDRPWIKEPKPSHVIVKGLAMGRAANFPQRGGLKAVTGWRIEDCIVEWNNGGGMGGEGDDMVFLRVIAQDNGFAGMGSQGKSILFEDCVSRRNNHKGFPVGWDGGGGKSVRTEGLKFIGHTAYENVGPGIWLDWENRDFVIRECVCYGNYGNAHDWEGVGVFIEASEGPGLIENNVIYSNTGDGIALAESQHVTVKGNVVVDNGSAIGLRAMEGRAAHKLENLSITDNVFKDWRREAVATSLGTWDRNSPAAKKIVIDGNLYSSPERESRTVFRWSQEKFSGLEGVREALGFERNGRTGAARFDRKLVKSRTRKSVSDVGIAKSLEGAAPGALVYLPVNGRTDIERRGEMWACDAFDLANDYVTLHLPDDRIKELIERTVSPFPMSEPVFIKMRRQPPGDGAQTMLVLDVLNPESLHRDVRLTGREFGAYLTDPLREVSGTAAVDRAGNVEFVHDRLCLYRGRFPLQIAPREGLVISFEIASWQGKATGDPVELWFIAMDPENRSGDAEHEGAVGRFWKVGKGWQNGIHTKDKTHYGDGRPELLGGNPVVGDKVEFVIGATSGDARAMQGLEVRINGKATDMFSNWGSHPSTVQFGFSAIKGAVFRNLRVNFAGERN